MRARGYSIKDAEAVKAVFDKFYSEDKTGKLNCPDFMRDFMCAFVVSDDDNRIITAGGVRTIAEVCIVTDKDRSPRTRVEALREVLRISGFVAKENRYAYLHAITDDPTWAHHMRQNGFVDRGADLLIHVGDIK
jgi:hypothetical protein